MAKISTICPKCGKNTQTVKVKRSTLFGSGSTITILSCGHRIIKRDAQEQTIERDEIWDKLHPFQRDGVKFIENSGFRCLLADKMGLGKTVQTLATIRYHLDKLSPILYIVKSSVKYQWQEQIKVWLKDDKDAFNALSQIITNQYSEIIPVKHTIISMDMLDKMQDKIIERGFKTIVVDESQNFKSMDAVRFEALTKIVEESRPRNIICLSGTPVLNRASEFFTTLNLIRPEQWRSYAGFVGFWCTANRRGTNIGGIKKHLIGEFKKITAPYILSREKRDVLKDLPPFQRNYEWIVIEDQKIKDAYNNQLKELNKHLDFMDTLRNESAQQMALLGYLEKLRQLAAISKIPWVVEYVSSFLTVEENEKIMIGLHHNIAIEFLAQALSDFKPIIIDGRDNAERKFAKVNLFKNDPRRRVTIASILAAGEGTDGFQHACSNMLTLERMWNLSKEMQFEARLDRDGQTKPVTNTLLLAKGTVDEYFTEVVMEKEEYVLTTNSENRDAVDNQMRKHAKSLNYIDLAKKCVSNFLE